MSRRSLDEELVDLEKQVQTLAALCERLQLENRSLRGQRDTLVEERARLLDKNETARGKVEQMIVRLKAMEAGH